MPLLDLTAPEIQNLVGTRHAVTGFEYPVAGLQPYYAWLVRTLHLLGESAASAGGLRVAREAQSATSVAIAPGRACINGGAVAFAGATLDLAIYNNAVAHVWLARDGSDAVIGHGNAGDGWPDSATTPHVKLAEVTLSAGEVTAVLDRRGEALFVAEGGSTLGFFGATPSGQPASANQAAVTPANINGEIGSLTFSASYDAAEVEALRDKCETLADDCRAAIVLANELRAALVALGLIKGSA